MTVEKNIAVTSSIVIVPYDDARFYFKTEIQREGKWRNNVSVIPVLFPEQYLSKVPNEWIEWIFNSMDQVREYQGASIIKTENKPLEVGLIDVQVYFEGDESSIFSLFKQNEQQFIEHNVAHFDELTKGTLHDQMILLGAIHTFDKHGKLKLHFHNIIFGLCVANELISHLNIEPLLSALGSHGKPINIVMPTW